MSYKDELQFEIYVAELIEQFHPKSISDLETISDDLHNCLEIGIRDFVDSTDGVLNYDEYTPCY